MVFLSILKNIGNMRNLKDILEGIFDDEDIQMDKLDDLTKFGNFYHIKWYDMSDDHTFPYMFKQQTISKLAENLGKFDWKFYQGIINNTGKVPGMTMNRRKYMLPLATIIGHVRFSKNREEFEKKIQQFIRDNERSLPIHVSVEDKTNSRVIKDDTIDIFLRVMVDDKSKYIRIRFEKNI